jgi:hypothetical protein
MERDVERSQAEAFWQDYLARTRTSTSHFKNFINFNRLLEEHQILLSLQERNLKV